METGFLNKHDSEYFSSDATYEQSNGFESEGSFFSSFVNGYNNEFDEYQWGIADEENNLNDTSFNVISNEAPVHQDDFNKSFNDWQQHISNLKLREDEIFPSCSSTPLTNQSLPSLLDDPLNPDLLLDELAAAAAVIPVSPDSPLPEETKIRIKIESGTKEKVNSSHGIPIKQEPVDFFCIDLPPAELLETFESRENESSSTAHGNTSTDLGPDNYDVVDIKVEREEEEEEEDEVDIETVTDSMPVIEANDIDSLLDQFEASERVNNMCKSKMKETKPNHRASAPTQSTPKVPPLIIKKMNSQLKVEQASLPKIHSSLASLPKILPAPLPKTLPSPAPSPVVGPAPIVASLPIVEPASDVSPSSSPFSVPKNGPMNKTIIDSLPQEVIDRIKKSSSKKKKVVPVVPAERLPAKGNSYIKDAGASKLKVRDLANKKKVKTEAAQMDHDYCTNENGQVTTKLSNENGKITVKLENSTVSQTPLPKPPVTVVVDAFSVTEEDKWVLDNEQKLLTSLPTASPSPSEASSNARNSWEKNSKRDSGLESGDVSDASESPSDKKCPPKRQIQSGENFVSIEIKVEKEDCPDALQDDKVDYHTEVPNLLPGSNNEPAYEQEKNEPKKKKLNLDEYRSRRKFPRLSSPVKTGTIGEAIMSNKWVQRPPKNKVEEHKPVEEKNNRVSSPETSKEALPKKYDEVSRRRNSRSRERTRSRYRHRSSSGSSSGSRARSTHIRGRSRDRIRRAPHRSRSRERNYRSRSSSRSSFSDSSSSSSRSRSGSGSRSRSSRSSRYRGRSRSRSRSCYRRTNIRRYSQRVSSDRAPRRSDDWSTGERQKQVEERRVIYVGQIEEGTTKAQLRERFQCFGPIVDISLHFRERGDNYGFVTFAYKGDAYKAVEHGNDNLMEPRYDICFGGRRAFCKQRYADLDSMAPQPTYSPFHQSRSNESFDSLLRAAREKILRGQKNV